MYFYDVVMWSRVSKNVNLTVPWYLGANYAYHHLDQPILSDGFFDRLVSLLDARWDEIEHFHNT